MSFIVTKGDTAAELTEALKARHDFFAMVGYAVTRWSYVDAALFEAFAWSLSAGRNEAAAVYYKNNQISQRLQLTDTLLKAVAPAKAQKIWDDLRKKIEKHISFRNHLAHEMPIQVIRVIAQCGVDDPSLLPPPEHFWQIATNEAKLLRQNPQRVIATIDEIRTHVEDVEGITSALNVFLASLPKKPPTRRAQSSRPSRPPNQGSARSGVRKSSKLRRQPRS